VSDLAERVAPIARRAAEERIRAGDPADDWYDLGWTSSCGPGRGGERVSPRAELDPGHVEAHLNLGRLVHEAGDALRRRAPRLALKAAPESAIAAQTRRGARVTWARRDRIDLYGRAILLDPRHAEAHYNLARLHERAGRADQALRHLSDYRSPVGFDPRRSRVPGTSSGTGW
jgi:tetratricopeptide (TPR) repeat protein